MPKIHGKTCKNAQNTDKSNIFEQAFFVTTFSKLYTCTPLHSQITIILTFSPRKAAKSFGISNSHFPKKSKVVSCFSFEI